MAGGGAAGHGIAGDRRPLHLRALAYRKIGYAPAALMVWFELIVVFPLPPLLLPHLLYVR